MDATISLDFLPAFTQPSRNTLPPSTTLSPARSELANLTPLAAASTITGSGSLIASLLSQAYTIEDPPAVARFLDNYPFLAPILVEAWQQIGTYFPQSTVVLEVFIDPEFGEAPKLIAAINPTVPPDEAVLRYRRFQRAWWVPTSRLAHGLLVIMPEYR